MVQISAPFMPVLMNQLRPVLPAIAEGLRSGPSKALKEAVKSGHIRALKNDIAPAAKVERYSKLRYAVIEMKAIRLILGDSVLVFRVDSPRLHKSFLEKDDTLRGVYLPLGPDKLLVGSTDGSHPDSADLRNVIAECCLEYFIADEDSPSNQLLQGAIGKNAALITTTELEGIFTDLITE
jgi:hypothetical protein